MSFSAPNKIAGQKITNLYELPLPKCISKNDLSITYLYISVPIVHTT